MTKRQLTEEEKQELLTNRFTAPFKGETIGHVELSEEEKEKAKKELEEFIKKDVERRKAREFDEKKNK
ncbi:hypothetical protein [uncultured Anaerococcus sp.]|uniref:hypothetical protein n=1 Tax=uncultured Anaerococcus sp. TaxID=293428 RepID=UPI002889B781|nr:hypothetical protein [uncultured Anaerococcus sp.]